MPTHSRIQSRRPTQTAGGNANASTQTGGHIALVGFDGDHSWSAIRITFKPDR